MVPRRSRTTPRNVDKDDLHTSTKNRLTVKLRWYHEHESVAYHDVVAAKHLSTSHEKKPRRAPEV